MGSTLYVIKDKKAINELKLSKTCSYCDRKAKYVIVQKIPKICTLYLPFCTIHTRKYLRESGISDKRINKVLGGN